MSREQDSTTTLVSNKFGSLDGTIYTEDTENAGAPHIDITVQIICIIQTSSHSVWVMYNLLEIK